MQPDLPDSYLAVPPSGEGSSVTLLKRMCLSNNPTLTIWTNR